MSAEPSIRHDWTLSEIRALHDLPLFELVDRARAVHLAFHQKEKVQLCTLLSVKTGGCPEDCAYCPQSSRHAKAAEGAGILNARAALKRVARAQGPRAAPVFLGPAL